MGDRKEKIIINPTPDEASKIDLPSQADLKVLIAKKEKTEQNSLIKKSNFEL